MHIALRLWREKKERMDIDLQDSNIGLGPRPTPQTCYGIKFYTSDFYFIIFPHLVFNFFDRLQFPSRFALFYYFTLLFHSYFSLFFTKGEILVKILLVYVSNIDVQVFFLVARAIKWGVSQVTGAFSSLLIFFSGFFSLFFQGQGALRQKIKDLNDFRSVGNFVQCETKSCG